MPANDTFEVVDGRDDLPIQIYYGLDRPELTLHEFRVYIHLVRRASGTGRAWPSYKSIGEYCFRASYPNSDQDTLTRQAKATIKKLEAKGLISVEKRVNSDGSHKTNVYRINPQRLWKLDAPADDDLTDDKPAVAEPQPTAATETPQEEGSQTAQEGGAYTPPLQEGGGGAYTPGVVHIHQGGAYAPKEYQLEDNQLEDTKRERGAAQAPPPRSPEAQDDVPDQVPGDRSSPKNNEPKRTTRKRTWRDNLASTTQHAALSDARKLFRNNGRLPVEAGANPAQVWYEFFSILQPEQRLTDIQIDQICANCPDLPRLRTVLLAHSLSGQKINNLAKVIDWYLHPERCEPYLPASTKAATDPTDTARSTQTNVGITTLADDPAFNARYSSL